MPSAAQRSIVLLLDADVVDYYEAVGADLSEVVNALLRDGSATRCRAISTAQERHDALGRYLDRVLLEEGLASDAEFEAEAQHFLGLLAAAEDGPVR